MAVGITRSCSDPGPGPREHLGTRVQVKLPEDGGGNRQEEHFQGTRALREEPVWQTWGHAGAEKATRGRRLERLTRSPKAVT